jgi:hypothetical protein
MRKALCLLAAIIVTAYLYALWSDWFTEADLSWVGKRPFFSERLDLSKPGPIVWSVPKEKWGFTQGKAQLALSLNLNTLREIPSSREQVELRVKIRAEGRQPGGAWQDRLIRDWYYTTDEPFPGTGLGESYGLGRLEYVLAAVQVVADEALLITVDVQVPDGHLMTGNPRLKIIGDHDYAAFGPHMAILFALREGGFWLSVGLVFVLAVLALRPLQRSGPSSAGPQPPLASGADQRKVPDRPPRDCTDAEPGDKL